MFVLSFFVMWENDLIRKLRLISILTTLQTGKQEITIHISPSISRSKGDQTVKFGQLIEYNVRIFFFKIAENDAMRLVPDLFLFIQKPWYEIKASDLHLSFNIFRKPVTCTYNEKTVLNSRLFSRDMLYFDFLEKGLGQISSLYSVYSFSRKTLLMLYSINWRNFIVRSPLILEMSSNTCIVIFFPACYVINYQAIFLHDQKSHNKYLKIFRTIRDFQVK